MNERVVMQVANWPVEFGGEQHSGWLPENAAVPERTPRQTILLNLRIIAYGDGNLGEHEPVDSSIEAVRPFAADSWHANIDDAVAMAKQRIRIEDSDWTH